jgi:hypothetical protein
MKPRISDPSDFAEAAGLAIPPARAVLALLPAAEVEASVDRPLIPCESFAELISAESSFHTQGNLPLFPRKLKEMACQG